MWRSEFISENAEDRSAAEPQSNSGKFPGGLAAVLAESLWLSGSNLCLEALPLAAEPKAFEPDRKAKGFRNDRGPRRKNFLRKKEM